MYKLYKDIIGVKDVGVVLNDTIAIPFDPANTDYARFKLEINDDQAELQDADGTLMTASDAKAFVATLP